MNREATMIVTWLLGAKMQKDGGGFPKDADVKRAFDSAELILREADARYERFRKLEKESENIRRAADEKAYREDRAARDAKP